MLFEDDVAAQKALLLDRQVGHNCCSSKKYCALLVTCLIIKNSLIEA